MFFCIKLLYVDDSSTLASDHALLVNRTAALCFNLGQFVLVCVLSSLYQINLLPNPHFFGIPLLLSSY